MHSPWAVIHTNLKKKKKLAQSLKSSIYFFIFFILGGAMATFNDITFNQEAILS